mgnify:CR=1 FL=1
MCKIIKNIQMFLMMISLVSCATLPEPEHEVHKFPKNAYIKIPDKEFEKLGLVRAKVNFPTLHWDAPLQRLCQNYFNKATKQLISLAKKNGGDAVVDVKSVVFFMDGTSQTYSKAECADDGLEGQNLARGVAVRWKRPENLKKTVK